MQPSAQGIASLFMGNPGALAARVDQDRKSSPMGIPDDLRQLMALNIVTNETDAAKRQQALNELQQMAPNGQPPTVAQSLRQQAAQKLQARMVQEQQKQQAMQQMMGGLPAAGIPQGVPQPERQPQGIDEAPVEFGMASGGIVSFNGEEGSRVPQYETLSERAERQMREKGSIYDPYFGYPEEERKRRKQEAEMREAQERAAGFSELAQGNVQAIVGAAQTRLADLQQNKDDYIRRFGAKQYQQAVDRATAALGTAQTRGSEILGRQAQRGQEGIAAALPPPPPPKPEAPISRPTEQRTLKQMEALLKPPAPAPAPRVERDKRTNMPMVSEAPGPVAEPQAASAAPQFQDSITLQGVLNQAEAAKLRGQQDYEERIGRPSYAALDKLMAEYERQKAAAEGPKAGFAGLAEYLAQIAATPRGMSSFEAGAAGARGVQALERERAAQRAALTEKQIGLEQKRIDADRQYAKDLLGIGNAEYDRALKANLSLFEEEGKTKRQAMSDASAMTREQFRAQAELKAIEIRARFQERLQAMPSAQERLRDDAIREYQKEFPKATRFAAMMALGFAGPQGERSASPGEQLRAAEYLSQYGEPSDIQSGVAVARRVAGIGSTPSAIPPSAVEALRKNPSLAAQFDQKYGKGAAAQYLQK